MAKLSANGRTELARLERVREEEIRGIGKTIHRKLLAFLSDGTILARSSRSSGLGVPLYRSGWTKWAKLKAELAGTDPRSLSTWRKLLAKGYTEVPVKKTSRV